MPTVPMDKRRVKEQVIGTPQVQRADLGLVETAKMYSKALGDIQSAGLKVYDNYQKEKKKGEEAEIDKHETEYVKELNRIVYDKDSGFLNYKNQEPAKRFKETEDNFKKWHEKKLSTIENENIRKRLEQKFQNYSQQLNGNLNRHTFSENQRFQKKTVEDFIEAKTEAAINDYTGFIPKTDPKTGERYNAPLFAESQDDIHRKIDKLGSSTGMSSEGIARRKMEANDKLHLGVVKRMLSEGKDLRAKEWVKQIKEYKDTKAVTAETMTALNEMVQEGSKRGEAQRSTQELFDKYGHDKATALTKAREIADPEVQDMVVTRLKGRFQEKDQIIDEDRKMSLDFMIDRLYATKGLYDAPEEKFLSLDPSRQAIYKRLKKDLTEGKDYKTNMKTYDDLKTLASVDPDAFLKKSIPAEGVGKLSRADQKTLIDLQSTMRKKGKDVISDGIRSNRQVVDDGILGFIDKKSDPEDYGMFHKRADALAEDWKRANNKKEIPNSELQKIVDNLKLDIIKKKGLIWDDKAPVYKMELSDIPASELPKIKAALIKRGKKPTESNILQLWSNTQLLKQRK